MNVLNPSYAILAIGDIQLQATNNSQLDEILAQNRDVIEEIWQKSVKETGAVLFNSTLPNFISIDSKGLSTHSITCHFIEYKSLFAQIKRPDLNLGITPVGVSGIFVLREADKEYIIFAKRESVVTEYPAFWELVPSGSIDKEYLDVNGIIDYKANLLAEFSEEIGLSQNYVKDICSFAFVLDTNHNVYDICCKISVESTREFFFAEFKGTKEYQAPIAIDIDKLGNFTKDNSNSIVPSSIAIVDAYMRELK